MNHVVPGPRARDKRRKEAEARNKKYRDAHRDPKSELAALDQRFGKGQGAPRQRARLAKLLGE